MLEAFREDLAGDNDGRGALNCGDFSIDLRPLTLEGLDASHERRTFPAGGDRSTRREMPASMSARFFTSCPRLAAGLRAS